MHIIYPSLFALPVVVCYSIYIRRLYRCFIPKPFQPTTTLLHIIYICQKGLPLIIKKNMALNTLSNPTTTISVSSARNFCCRSFDLFTLSNSHRIELGREPIHTYHTYSSICIYIYIPIVNTHTIYNNQAFSFNS